MTTWPHPSTRKPGRVLVRYTASAIGPVTYRGMKLSQGIVEQRRHNGHVDLLRWHEAVTLHGSLEEQSPERMELEQEARKIWKPS